VLLNHLISFFTVADVNVRSICRLFLLNRPGSNSTQVPGTRPKFNLTDGAQVLKEETCPGGGNKRENICT
jgi:hypothetical protein